MHHTFPDYLSIPPDQIGIDTPVQVRVGGDMADLAQRMAREMFDIFQQATQQARNATIIAPVGPVDQFPILAEMINREGLNCQNVLLINMDEYLTNDDKWVAIDHPLSFRGYMNRKFYDLIDPDLAPLLANRVFPDPQNPTAVQRLIDDRGGVDACFGGIGINGHMAFNEPPEPGQAVSVEQFAALPTRSLDLTRETRTINSVTVGGEISIIPWRAVTVGMKEILESRQLRFYCNRPWQSSVVRRVLHGPISASCPASLMRTHQDAVLTIASYVAQPPSIGLR